MSGDNDDGGTTDFFGDMVAAEWGRWRKAHPVRTCAPAAGGIADSKRTKPSVTGGAPWTTYRNLQGNSSPGAERPQQEWLYVPYASLVGCPDWPSPTQPLAGFSGIVGEGARLHTFMPLAGGDGQMEVYTNIYRIMQLAATHPAIDDCKEHAINKATETRILCERTLRATKGHQAPFNLKLTLAASGAPFRMGVTALDVREDLLAIWYCPGKHCTLQDLNMMRFVFSTSAKRSTSAEGEHAQPLARPLA